LGVEQYHTAMWHYGQGMVLARLADQRRDGRALAEATRELDALRGLAAQLGREKPDMEARPGLGRIVALYYRSSTS
jgi:hypothetical protein